MRHPQILADLDVKRKSRLSARSKQQIAAKWDAVPGDLDHLTDDVLARGKLPALIEFSVIRQVYLGNDAKQFSLVDRHAAIVEVPSMPQWGSEDKNRKELPACRYQVIDLPLDFVKYRILKQQIVDRIGREPQFGEHH